MVLTGWAESRSSLAVFVYFLRALLSLILGCGFELTTAPGLCFGGGNICFHPFCMSLETRNDVWGEFFIGFLHVKTCFACQSEHVCSMISCDIM